MCRSHRADHQLKRIKRAGQRGVEGPGDRRRRAATDQDPQVGTPDAKGVADAGGDGGPNLGIGRFQSDRRADAVGNNCLQHHHQTSCQRHAAPEQGIRLNRIDGSPGIDTGDAKGHTAKHQSAHRGDRDG